MQWTIKIRKLACSDWSTAKCNFQYKSPGTVQQQIFQIYNIVLNQILIALCDRREIINLPFDNFRFSKRIIGDEAVVKGEISVYHLLHSCKD